MRRRILALLLLSTVIACGGGGSGKPAKYPDVKLHTPEINLKLEDPRKEVRDRFTEARTVDQSEEHTYPQQLPESFDARIRERLAKVTGSSGPKLQVTAQVRRCDVTFYNDKLDGDFVRYDVVISFQVRTMGGALLDKGAGGAYKELPAELATQQEMMRVFSDTAIAAVDQYWASKKTLQTVNEQIGRYLETHPNER